MKKLYIRYDSPSAGGTMRTIYIKTDDVDTLSNILDSVQLAYWRHEGEIEVSPSNFKSFMEVAYQNDYESIPEDKQAENRMKAIKVPKPLPLRDEVKYPKFKMEPLEIQKEGIIYGLEKERFLLADIMGPQPLWAKVHTPNGWTTMGELKVGDYVTGQDGKPKEVKEVIEQGEDTVYEITFSDRTKAYSTGNHLWEVRSPEKEGTTPIPLWVIKYMMSNNFTKYTIPLVEPIRNAGVEYGPIKERLEYMQDLLGDKVWDNNKKYEIKTHEKSSADEIVEIARSLGAIVTQDDSGTNLEIRMNSEGKSIVSIEEYSHEETRCISVDDSLYLTDGYTVTHNTGKTGTSMYLAEYLLGHYDFKHVLVINGVYNNQFNWEKEVEDFLYNDARILGIRDKRNGGRRVGTGTEKLKDLEDGIEETYIITNIATIRNDKIVDKLEEMIYNNTIGMVIVDEIHYCIGGSSKQGKNLQKLRPRFRLGMSGSPFNEPTDMYDIEAWLGTTYLNRRDYKNQYGVEQITDKTRMIAAKRRAMPFAEYFFNQPEKFKEDISRFMLRRTDVLKGLPGITFTDYLVEMGNLQRQAYDQISAEVGIDLSVLSLDQLEEELSGSEYMDERKMMSCPHVFDVNEDVKLDAIKTLLTEIIANDKTAIVYGFFVETIKNYEKELSKEFPGKGNYVTADTEDVFKVIDDFQNGKGNFLVGGVKKIGTGFNITRADYVIYADRPATWNDYEQSYMRAWRRGRKDPVRVIKILCVDTWDDKMSWKLLERKSQSDKILGANQTADNVIDGRYE